MMCFPRNTSLGKYLKMPSRVYAWCQEILYIPDEVTISLRLKFRYAESLEKVSLSIESYPPSGDEHLTLSVF